jgi:CheY-like chemotaxis protein
MTALIVVLMFVAFVGLDLLIRYISRRYHEHRVRQERQAVLQTSVRLDFSHEAPSLKRVEVPTPKGRILAVDDEPVILDAFRRILVLEGFSVDTVERGQEALGLVQRHDYDFVFTDLKMPEMDGVEVVKAVKHFRPDVDVVVVTGYGTIETAVQTLQHGACEYVQKPFTADELADFARKLLIKREARLEAQRQPTIRVVAPHMAERVPAHEYCIPGGAFLSPAHVWVRIEEGGQVRLGIDDFSRKALGEIRTIQLPEANHTYRRGETLFTLHRGEEAIHFPAPLSGRVVSDNVDLNEDPGTLTRSPYEEGWICLLQPTDLAAELVDLRIGKPVVEWYQEELSRLRAANRVLASGAVGWPAFEELFVKEDHVHA